MATGKKRFAKNKTKRRTSRPDAGVIAPFHEENKLMRIVPERKDDCLSQVFMGLKYTDAETSILLQEFANRRSGIYTHEVEWMLNRAYDTTHFWMTIPIYMIKTLSALKENMDALEEIMSQGIIRIKDVVQSKDITRKVKADTQKLQEGMRKLKDGRRKFLSSYQQIMTKILSTHLKPAQGILCFLRGYVTSHYVILFRDKDGKFYIRDPQDDTILTLEIFFETYNEHYENIEILLDDKKVKHTNYLVTKEIIEWMEKWSAETKYNELDYVQDPFNYANYNTMASIWE